MGRVDIELLYFAGCPNWYVAQDRLGQALKAAGRTDQPIRLRAVETDQDAQALSFPGSPTIRINGHDPFPASAQAAGLSCRVYPTPDGLDGAPTVAALVQALENTP